MVTQDNLVDLAEMNFLAGGGEMGRRIRAFNWAETAVGCAETWSPALRTTLQIILANRFPLLLWWGPEYIQFYNDAYSPIPGTKHPHQALGRPASECWSEIWHVIGPLIDRPYYGGPATWNDDILLEVHRHGFLEESHFTIAYSPVPDPTAPTGIGGVLATVHEITEKVIGERRVAVLRDLGARAADAKTAEEACAIAARTLEGHARDIPFALLYLIDRDGQRAQFAGAAGVAPGAEIGPLHVDLNQAEGGRAGGQREERSPSDLPVRHQPSPAERRPRIGEGGPMGAALGWPLAEARQKSVTQVVTQLHQRFENIPTGPWADPPDTAVVMTVPSSKPHEPAGFLIAGISARLKLDRSYRDFLDLVRTQIATAIGNARAYEEERKRAEALAEIDRSKTIFFSNVSHEFRTPLTLMLSPLDELLSRNDGEISPEIKSQLQLINRNGGRLLRLVNTLLDFSRIEAGRIRAVYEPTDISAYTAELSSVFRAATERAGLRLVVDCPPISQPVYVDPEMWEKIVLNLVSNAFKFTFEGEIVVSVRELAAQNGPATDTQITSRNGTPQIQRAKRGWVELRVRDTGVGIPADAMPRLFERFYRVEATRGRTYEGSGIGLAFVQELVKLHGGAVTVESEVNQGTTFSVRIPLGTAHLPSDRVSSQPRTDRNQAGFTPFVEEALRWLPDAPEKSSADILSLDESTGFSAPQLTATTPTDRPSVLLAEDNADMRGYVKRLLAARYNVNAVADGRAALAAAKINRPDVILSDVMMPGLDGFGLLREVRGDSNLRDVPVILLSARAGEESRLEGLAEGADDYVVKPFSARELSARVEAHVQLARLRREVERTSRQRAEQFETLLNQAPMGVYLVDADFRIAQMNPTARAVFGTIENPVGRDFDEVIHVMWEKEYADEIVRIFRHTLATGEPYQTRERTGYRVDRQATEHYEWRIDRIWLPDGRYGVVCYFRDVSERKRHEAALAHAQEQLRVYAANLEVTVAQRTADLKVTVQELEAFSYSIAHDMRAPLRAMQGFAKLLSEEHSAQLNDLGKTYLKRLWASAGRLDALIQDVLNYSKIARAEMSLDAVDAEGLLREIIESYPNLQAVRANICVAGPFVRVRANRAALTQVIANLLGNAVKFVKKGVAPEVKVWSERPLDGSVRIWFEDNGIGMRPESVERIFLMFQRLNPQSEYDGTGIGLAIVRKTMERMNGKVGVESALGQGSRFWITLKPATAS
jgi:PAS domain S-box-containing protein